MFIYTNSYKNFLPLLYKLKKVTMYTTYHLNSASDINADILDAIKTTFKERPIVLTVEEELDATTYLMSTDANKTMLDKSIAQAKNKEFIEIKMEDL